MEKKKKLDFIPFFSTVGSRDMLGENNAFQDCFQRLFKSSLLSCNLFAPKWSPFEWQKKTLQQPEPANLYLQMYEIIWIDDDVMHRTRSGDDVVW